jgi:hypothetical protein
MAREPNDYALVIGIQHYPEYRPLQGPIGDARRFGAWLRHPKGGGLPKANYELIVSAPGAPGAPPAPVKGQVDAALRRIRKASAAGARRLYFYFSGHGMQNDNLELALCLANWSRDQAFAALSYEQYFKFFLKLGNFEEVVFFLDCCRVREIAVGGYGPESSVIRPASKAVSAFPAFATEVGTPSYEAKMAEEEAQGRPAVVRGHFTQALLEALCGGAAVPPCGVPADRLEAHLKVRTTEIAQDHGHEQVARVAPDIRPGTSLVFGCCPALASLAIDFIPPRPDIVTLFGPQSEVVRSGPAGTEPWNLVLSPGKYVLKDAAHEKFFRLGGRARVQHESF